MTKLTPFVLLACSLAATTQPASQPVFRPVQGQRVETYWVRQWWSATVRDVRGDQVLIRNDQRAHSEDWVPLANVRKYTKAAKYPIPAAEAEIDAQTQIESARRQAAIDHRPPLRPLSNDPSFSPTPDTFVDAPLTPATTAGATHLNDNPADPLPPGLAPDIAPVAAVASPRPIPLSGGPANLHNTARLAILLLTPDAAHAVTVSEALGAHPIRLAQRFDLAAGTASPVATFESSVSISSLSPDGLRVVGINRDRHGTSEQPIAVEAWSVDAKEAKLLVSFAPVAEGMDSRFPGHVTFTDPGHVLTLSSAGQLALWEIPAAKAVYVRDLGRVATSFPSATEKYLAVCDEKSIRLLDTATGNFLGQLPAASPPIHPTHVAFSPSGTRLLASEKQRVVVYDLQKPDVVADIALPAPLGGGAFLSDDYLVVNGRYLVDVAAGVVLWDYPHGGGFSPTVAGRVWYLSHPEPPYTPSLYSASLPTSDALKAAAGGPPADRYAVRPGTPVSLKLDTGLSAAGQAAATAALGAAVTAAGWTVADDAPVRLVATHAAGEAKEITYSMFNGETHKVSAAPHTYTLAVQLDGKDLWQSATTLTPPGMIRLPKDQAVEQLLDAQRDDYATYFFTNTRFPKYLAKPSDHPGLGQTQLPGTTPPSDEPPISSPNPPATRPPVAISPKIPIE